MFVKLKSIVLNDTPMSRNGKSPRVREWKVGPACWSRDCGRENVESLEPGNQKAKANALCSMHVQDVQNDPAGAG